MLSPCCTVSSWCKRSIQHHPDLCAGCVDCMVPVPSVGRAAQCVASCKSTCDVAHVLQSVCWRAARSQAVVRCGRITARLTTDLGRVFVVLVLKIPCSAHSAGSSLMWLSGNKASGHSTAVSRGNWPFLRRAVWPLVPTRKIPSISCDAACN